MISGLMVDVDGVLVCGRPSDGQPWASNVENDLGLSIQDLQREFFTPHWDDIVIGRSDLIHHLKPALAKIAPHLSHDDFIAYWFENDARLNIDLLEEIGSQRRLGRKVFLATNQEHRRAMHLMEALGLGSIATVSTIRRHWDAANPTRTSSKKLVRFPASPQASCS